MYCINMYSKYRQLLLGQFEQKKFQLCETKENIVISNFVFTPIFFFSPLGLVPEVPLLQAFENDVGRGWTRFVVAGLAVICLNITLLELSLPLHSLVSYHIQLLGSISSTCLHAQMPCRSTSISPTKLCPNFFNTLNYNLISTFMLYALRHA